MLTVRVEGGAIREPYRREIWEGVVGARRERKMTAALRALSADPLMLGEHLYLRVQAVDGRGLHVEGAMLECEVTDRSDSTVAAVEFAFERWRAW